MVMGMRIQSIERCSLGKGFQGLGFQGPGSEHAMCGNACLGFCSLGFRFESLGLMVYFLMQVLLTH
jgi:hypothetical protein